MDANSHEKSPRLSADARQMLVGFLQAETLQQDTQVRSNLNQVFQYGILAFAILGAVGPLLAQHKQYVALLALAPVGFEGVSPVALCGIVTTLPLAFPFPL